MSLELPTPASAVRDKIIRLVSRWLDWIYDQIVDPARARIIVPVLCLGHAFLWTIYGVIAKGSQDIHFDMGEAIVWAQEIELVTPKHPPLSAWLARGWFDVFPRTDWAFYLFAMSLSAASLWFAWLLTSRFVAAEKRPVGLVLLTFVPFFTFHALKYNNNTIMIPLWGLATWTFLRSFPTRSPLWAAAAGFAAAAVMLAKYWGIFLLAGFGTAVLFDPRRADYFRSWSPWISIIVGFALLAPHLYSVGNHDFDTFNYALQSHHTAIRFAALRSSLSYLLGVLGYLIIPLFVISVVARWKLSSVEKSLIGPDSRQALIITLIPIILPIAAASLASSDINSLWTMGGFALLPTVLLSSPRVSISREKSRVILACAFGLPIISIMFGPAIAIAIHLQGSNNSSAHYRILADRIDEKWSMSTSEPLRLIGGDGSLVNGVSFYSEDRPSTLDVLAPHFTPWADPARVRREGITWVCPMQERVCVNAIEKRTLGIPTALRSIVTVIRKYLGIEGAPDTYVIIIQLPEGN